MGVKEQGLLEYLKDSRRYADLFNGSVFGGRQVMMPEYLKKCPRKKRLYLGNYEIPDKELQKRNSSGKKKQAVYMERERDMFRCHDMPGRKCYLACEGQAGADSAMPVRTFTYDGVEYSNQLSEGETEGGYLVPVFHVVLYLGEKRWSSRQTLQDMMAIPESLLEFKSLLPDYRICQVDIHEQNQEQFVTEWRDVFRLMRHSRKKEELKKYVEENWEELRALTYDTRKFLAILLDQYEIMENGEVEVKEMCEAWDGAMRMYAEEAKKETEERISAMNLRLLAEKRYQDMERAAKDREYREELCAAFGL